MMSFMRLLRATAQKHGLCVLVCIHSFVRCPCPCLIWASRRVETCCADGGDPGLLRTCIQVLNDATAAGHPALGASFTFLIDATVWLARLPGQDHELRTAHVLRSRISVRVHLPLRAQKFRVY